MLRMRRTLVFPNLVRIGEAPLKNRTTKDSKQLSIYCLDWSSVRDRGIGLNALPKNYSDMVDNFEFAISDSYLDQIRKSAREAVEVWSGRYPFDTMIREICMEPAADHVWVAFRLLEDCLYDKEEQWHSRKAERNFACEAMLMKFWMHQTGRGLVWEKSKMDKIESRFNYLSDDQKQSAHILEENFVVKTKEYHKKVCDFLTDLYPIDGDTVIEVPKEFKDDTNYKALINKKTVIYKALKRVEETDAYIKAEANGDYSIEIELSDGSVFSTEEEPKKINLKCSTNMKLTLQQIMDQIIKSPTQGHNWINSIYDGTAYIEYETPHEKDQFKIDKLDQVIDLNYHKGNILNIAGEKYIL